MPPQSTRVCTFKSTGMGHKHRLLPDSLLPYLALLILPVATFIQVGLETVDYLSPFYQGTGIKTGPSPEET